MFIVYSLSLTWFVNYLFNQMAAEKTSDRLVYVYMLIMKNGNFYTGWTTDLERRFNEHVSGKGAKFTKAFKPGKIAAAWKINGTKSDALKIEAFIKKKPRSEKEEIVKNPRILSENYKIKREEVNERILSIEVVTLNKDFIPLSNT